MRELAPWPGIRTITHEEVGYRHARWYADQEISHWREKRRKTHKLLKKARREIKLLRAQITADK